MRCGSTARRIVRDYTTLAIFLICAVGSSACGGGATTPMAPTTTPRTTFTLDVPADHIGYSQPLGQLVAGQTFNLLMTVAQINRADTENFAHSVDFWLAPPGTEAPPFSLTATSLSLAWSSGTQWVVGYLPHPGVFSYTTVRPTITTGAQRAVRITRAIDGSAQLWLDGINLWTVADVDSAPTLFIGVVGLRVDFAY